MNCFLTMTDTITFSPQSPCTGRW